MCRSTESRSKWQVAADAIAEVSQVESLTRPAWWLVGWRLAEAIGDSRSSLLSEDSELDDFVEAKPQTPVKKTYLSDGTAASAYQEVGSRLAKAFSSARWDIEEGGWELD